MLLAERRVAGRVPDVVPKISLAELGLGFRVRV